jgi:phosphoribosyl 1,2-cyclic phosphate phosphodiesterase
MAYITDANAIPEHEIPKLLDLDLLIINALGNKHHYSHFNLTEALEVVECIKPKQSFFTHISHVMGLHDQVNKNLPPYAQLAYDGLTIEL